MRVERSDFGAIKRATPTPQGGLRLDALPTRAGVLLYRMPNGQTRRELRHPDEVFKPESLESLKHAPLTDLHPAGRVDTSNFSALTRGHVSEKVARATDKPDHVAAEVLVQDGELIRLIDKGERKELSCGYSCDLVEEAGEYQGERYDARQVNITYNHLAVGPENWGRAGPTAALRLDGLGVELDKTSEGKPREERSDSAMKKHRIDGVDYEAGSDAHLQAVDKTLAKLSTDSAAATKRADDAAAELKTVQEKLDAAEKAAKPEAIAERVRERVALERSADAIMAKTDAKDFKCDGKDDVTLMVEVLDKAGPRIFGKSYKADAKAGRDAVKAVFDALKKAYDAMPSIGAEDPSEDEEPEEDAADGDMPDDEEPKDGGKKDSRDVFAARARAEGRGTRRDSKREERIDSTISHERMLKRLHSFGQESAKR